MNLFNKTFFSLLGGFVLIIFSSLVFLFLMGFYEVEVKGNTANTSGNAYSSLSKKNNDILKENSVFIPKLPSAFEPGKPLIEGSDEIPRQE